MGFEMPDASQHTDDRVNELIAELEEADELAAGDPEACQRRFAEILQVYPMTVLFLAVAKLARKVRYARKMLDLR